MTLTHPDSTASTPAAWRPPSASRRFGYTIAVVVNLALLYVVNIWPGWQSIEWLTPETVQVLGLVNASLAASAAVNMLYLVYDAPWFRSLGDLVTTLLGFAAVMRVLAVFPFDFSDYPTDWEPIARIVLVFAAIGAGIGVAVNLVLLVVRTLRAVTNTIASD